MSHLIQRQHIPFSQPWGVLVFHLSKLFDSIAVVSDKKGDAPSTEPQDAPDGVEAKAENTRQVCARANPSRVAGPSAVDFWLCVCCSGAVLFAARFLHLCCLVLPVLGTDPRRQAPLMSALHMPT